MNDDDDPERDCPRSGRAASDRTVTCPACGARLDTLPGRSPQDRVVPVHRGRAGAPPGEASR